jgi:hypothetical protein
MKLDGKMVKVLSKWLAPFWIATRAGHRLTIAQFESLPSNKTTFASVDDEATLLSLAPL